ncbi:MAG: VPLPA-CTERM-specific exosortase XrtD [Acidobacteria bacterium]|nr:VPLPA-CTERM-specific exosortase XrtD [Acidobacteriota bacterium]
MADSVQVAPLAVNKERRFFSGLPVWQGVALLLLLAFLYADVLSRLFTQWTSDKNFQHGIFVPAFALFVLWRNREKLRNVKLAPSWTGLALIVGGLATMVLGEFGAELFLSRVSLLFMLAGLIVLFHGWPLFRAVFFPWAFLLLMIPIPTIVLQKITFPLQILASKVASTALPLFGVLVHREGNVIELATMKLDVVQACSGIRSLLSMLTLSIIYGYLMEDRQWVRVVLAIASVPIAVFANSFRIVGTGLIVQYWDPDKAQGFLHAFEGWLIFVASLIMLFALHSLIMRIWKPGQRATHAVAPVSNLPVTPAKSAFGRFVAVVLLMAGTTFLTHSRSSNEIFPSREPLASFPNQFGPWMGQDLTIDQQTLDVLGAGEFIHREFENPSQPQPWIDLLIAYFPSQKAGDTLHSPNHCLQGSGWIPIQRAVIQLSRPDGKTFPANRFVTSKAGERQLVIYWFQAHDREVANEYVSKYYLIKDSIQMRRSDGALVRLYTPMFEKESPDAAQARLLSLGNEMIPQLNRYIPR